MILIYLITYSFYLTLTTIPLIGLFLLRMIKYGMDKYLKDCQSILDFVIYYKINIFLYISKNILKFLSLYLIS